MSASEEQKRIIIPYETSEILADLEFPALIRDYKRIFIQQFEYTRRLADTRDGIKTAVEAVKADTVTYREWQTTLVRPVAGQKLDMKKLQTNLMKMGKLDAEMVAKIFAASMVPKAAAEPYVRVTAPEGELPKKPKADTEEE